ncbi:uncharacterized protein METZ01_LOCUS1193 [marine metagenome]|uniref:Protein kinase domain-containing protein n=1 Tax=marine metagenome TaxID=408172 RepID=A0A381N1I3_9ZZZZ
MPFKLSLNFDSDSEDEDRFDDHPYKAREELGANNKKDYDDFIAKLKNIPKYRKGNKKGSKSLKKYKDCPIKIIKDGKQGASGVLDIQLDKKFLDRETHLINENMFDNSMFANFYFPRLKKYCKEINNYIRRSSKLFPNNFLQIKHCKYCIYTNKNNKDDIKILYKMQNASFNKRNSDNFKDDMEKNIYSSKQLGNLFCQVYYISVVSNKKGLFHNDLKPANIVINKARKNFVYSGLGNIKINIKKGDLIPIFVDYDLISFRKFEMDEGHPASGTSYDFSFFKQKNNKKNNKKYSKLFSDDYLPEFDERINSKKLKLIFKDFVNVE